MARLLLALSWTLLLATQAPQLSIGAIQGSAAESPYLNRFVAFRGVVVGRYEDRNTRGDVYYTLFVQSLPEEADGDPATSDGIAVFLGRVPRPDVALGDVVAVGGKVTEFYGLTEIDDRGLTLTVADSAPLPAPVAINPPADIAAAAQYFEALEGMRVGFDDAVVAGPTHEGCGFAVVATEAASALPLVRRVNDDPTGQAVPVLYPSDVACPDIPQVSTGDAFGAMVGTLTYSFDQFKVIIEGAEAWQPPPGDPIAPPAAPAPQGQQFSVATLNAEDYFDTAHDTTGQDEPVLTPGELDTRQTKLAHQIAYLLRCPTLLGLQEVEHAELLVDLAATLENPCGFVYQVSHRESPDARGIDNALLSDPRRVLISDAVLQQTCSPVPTGINDPTITCPAGEEPLFGRPPLQVDLAIDGRPALVYVNHFKSKRGGEIDTGLERIRQAVFLNALAGEQLAADPDAWLIALGDFNDTELSTPLALMTDPAQGGHFHNPLSTIPQAQRYTYNFGGISELIDGILLSPSAAGELATAVIVHANTDYALSHRSDLTTAGLPFRASDHDVAVVLLGDAPATPTPPPAVPAATVAPSPTATATAVATDTPAAVAVAPAPTRVPIPAASDAPPPAHARDRVWPLAAIGVVAALALVAVVLRRVRH